MQVLRAILPDKISGSYLGPVYPEPAAFKDPDVDLKKIGIINIKANVVDWSAPPHRPLET
jgi:hypothetical protein